MHVIRDSTENYLETILILSKEKDIVRAVDIAAHWKISKPSVSNAMKKLREQKLVFVEESGNIVLTREGLILAEEVYEKHLLIRDFLEYIVVDSEKAEEDACKIEHAISEESFEKFKAYYRWIKEQKQSYRKVLESKK